MKLSGQPSAIDWRCIPTSEQSGESGGAKAQTSQFGDIQVRLISFGPNYIADHWCNKGHVVFVIDGHIAIEHKGGQRFELDAGMSYYVGDDADQPHRVVSAKGGSAVIVD